MHIVNLFFDCYSYTYVRKGQRQNYGNYVDWTWLDIRTKWMLISSGLRVDIS